MKPDNKYVPFLDGFRGYAIIGVLIGHLFRDLLRVAFLGVTLFFFVSGFLITKLLIVEYQKNNRISLKDFYFRRIFRLYPALLFFLVVTCGFILLSGQQIFFPDIFSGLFYFTNYFLVYLKPAFLPGHYPLVSEILWSLSVEEHFYLFFPVLFLWLFNNKNDKLIFGLVIFLILFLFSRFFEFFRTNDLSMSRKIIYYTTHNRGDSILYGCVSALLIYRYEATRYLKYLKLNSLFVSSVLLLGLMEFVPSQLFENTIKYSLQGISLAFIVPHFLFVPSNNRVKKLLEGKLILFIGRLSYSLYLFHWLAIKIADFYGPQNLILADLLILILSFGLATVSFYNIERPFLALRRKFGSHAK